MTTCTDYAEKYRAAMVDFDAATTPYLREGHYTMRGDMLIPTDGKPLQPNTRLMAETIYQLHPRSVAEFGCGCGVNLHNLAMLIPRVRLCGYELCNEMIGLGHELFPGLVASIHQQDITRSFGAPMVDVTFTHVVLMHISERADRVMALTNMFNMTWRQMVLLENWSATNFKAEILEATAGQAVYFYTRLSPEIGRKHVLIVSRQALDYEPLIDYEAELAAPVRENWMNDHLCINNQGWMK